MQKGVRELPGCHQQYSHARRNSCHVEQHPARSCILTWFFALSSPPSPRQHENIGDNYYENYISPLVPLTEQILLNAIKNILGNLPTLRVLLITVLLQDAGLKAKRQSSTSDLRCALMVRQISLGLAQSFQIVTLAKKRQREKVRQL